MPFNPATYPRARNADLDYRYVWVREGKRGESVWCYHLDSVSDNDHMPLCQSVYSGSSLSRYVRRRTDLSAVRLCEKCEDRLYARLDAE